MLYRTHRPCPPLDRFIDRFWFYSDLQTGHNIERVLPDGTFELVIDLSGVPRKLFDQKTPGQSREFRGAWLSGPRADFIVIDVVQNTSMIGVHFKPGGAAPFLGMPSDELTGRVEETDGIWGSAMTRLQTRLLEERSVTSRFALLEEFLLQRLHIPEGDAAMHHAIHRLNTSPQVASTSELARELGISQKHFIELFRKRVGLTPKKFCRVRRFHNVLKEIEAKGSLEWAVLAADSGYYDQSHLIREFQSFCGLNPSQYLTDRGEHLGFVPIHH